MSEIPSTSLLFLLLSLALSLAIVVPLTGGLVRFRANYNPKGLQLDAEGGAQPHTGPVISTFFGMLKRVYRIEVSVIRFQYFWSKLPPLLQGWAGFYKGLSMPSFTALKALEIHLSRSSADFDGYCGPHNLRRVSLQVHDSPSWLIQVIYFYRLHKVPFLMPRNFKRSFGWPLGYPSLWNIYDDDLTPKCDNNLSVCLVVGTSITSH